MTLKYKPIRIPEEAKINFVKKQNVINEILKEEGLKKRWTFADNLRFFSQKPIYISNKEVVAFIRNKKSNFRRLI